LLDGDPKNGISPPASSKPPGLPTFSIGAIRDGRVNLRGDEHLKFVEVPEKLAQLFRVGRGDVLIVRGNANPDYVGQAAMVDECPAGCIYPDVTKRVVFRRHGEHTVTPEFGVLAWNHPIVHNQVLRRAKTSNGTLKINNRDVKQIVMPVPPWEQQDNLVRLVAATDGKREALDCVLRAHLELKKALMDDLLTGKVRIPLQQAEALAAR
jgi:type I restriction enzyme, S subunit